MASSSPSPPSYLTHLPLHPSHQGHSSQFLYFHLHRFRASFSPFLSHTHKNPLTREILILISISNYLTLGSFILCHNNNSILFFFFLNSSLCSWAIRYGGERLKLTNSICDWLIRWEWEARGGRWIARSDSHRDRGDATSRRISGTLASIQARHRLWLRGRWPVSQRHSLRNAGPFILSFLPRVRFRFIDYIIIYYVLHAEIGMCYVNVRNSLV